MTHELKTGFRKNDQLCPSVGRIGAPRHQAELGYRIDQLTHRLLGDAGALGEVGEAGTLRRQVDQNGEVGVANIASDLTLYLGECSTAKVAIQLIYQTADVSPPEPPEFGFADRHGS